MQNPALPAGPLMPARQVWQHFAISDRSLDRWLAAPNLAFPRPIVIRRRRYWRADEISAWERSRAAVAA